MMLSEVVAISVSGAVGIVILITYYQFRFQNRKAEASKDSDILREAFPDAWITILEKNLPLYRQLPEALKSSLQRKLLIFLKGKNFEGCGGLELSDDIIITIAGQACILLMGKDDSEPVYEKLKSILVYPGAYFERKSLIFPSLHEHEKKQVRLGESWISGSIVLAWDAVQQGAWDIRDGQNVVLHEFAHQLDQADGTSDGAPILNDRANYISWAKVFSKAFAVHVERSGAGRYTLMDEYGATNPAEFFAVATETYFEKPRMLKYKHPDLYRELSSFYGLDPASWDRTA